MTYVSGLAYLLGIEGAALLRGIREGTADRAFVEARIAEIRGFLDDPALAEGETAAPGGTAELYRDWAPRYDVPGNQLIDSEQPIVRRILDGLPIGDALDAACGTGRHARHLDRLGHRVIGVDASPEMLAVAREHLPDADLREGTLEDLPVPGDAVDLVVCALALSHVPRLEPVMAEFARVLRPGGHLVISDAHLLTSYLRPAVARSPDHHRPLSAYLAAALPLGFQVRHCEEPPRPRPLHVEIEPAPDPLPVNVGWDIWHRCPDAAVAAVAGAPIAVIWCFRLG
ncbi:class I SAM-dependent methyltransferase [Spirillospora sp. NPDC047279]|uniref:class I SAM-dependent DNA methyltransferase n=1 Tax=Spirillospora sp. NPDC047279 TaxID=3155478 RepID=UPI0033D68CE3